MDGRKQQSYVSKNGTKLEKLDKYDNTNAPLSRYSIIKGTGLHNNKVFVFVFVFMVNGTLKFTQRIYPPIADSLLTSYDNPMDPPDTTSTVLYPLVRYHKSIIGYSLKTSTCKKRKSKARRGA